MNKRVVWLLLCFACWSSGARTPGAPLKPGFNLFSREQDAQLGLEAAAQVRKQSHVTQNQFLQSYINRVGQRLASIPEARDSGFQFNFTMIDDPSLNAFALPGGPMFIHTGLLKAADNEAQLAGVMGHEMGHVILRHGTNQASKQNFIQLPAMLAGAVTGGSMLGQLAQVGLGLTANSVLLKFSRSAETEADAMGVRLMSEAGYNPIELARFFEKLDASGGSRSLQFLSDHPNPGNRQQAIEAEIRTLPQRNYGNDSGQFAEAKRQVGQLAPVASGSFRNLNATPSTAPSSQFNRYQSDNYSVGYPANWQVFGTNKANSVTIAPKEGLVQSNGATQVGLGTMISYYFPEGDTIDLRANTDTLISELRHQNPNLRATGSRQPLQIGTYKGLVTTLSNDSPFGGAETDGLLTVATPDGLFYLLFVAPQKNFDAARGIFEQMVSSVRFRNQ